MCTRVRREVERTGLSVKVGNLGTYVNAENPSRTLRDQHWPFTSEHAVTLQPSSDIGLTARIRVLFLALERVTSKPRIPTLVSLYQTFETPVV